METSIVFLFKGGDLAKVKKQPVNIKWARKAERSWQERVGDCFNIPCPIMVKTPKCNMVWGWFIFWNRRRHVVGLLRSAGVRPLSVVQGNGKFDILVKRQQYKYAYYVMKTNGIDLRR